MHRARSINTLNWIILGLMAASLPTSKYTFSMFQFFLAGLFVLDGISYNDFLSFHHRYKTIRKIILFIPFHLKLAARGIGKKVRELPHQKTLAIFLLLYLVHIAGLVCTENLARGFSELRVKLPLVLIPVFMLGFREIKNSWKSTMLLLFVLATFVASLYSTFLFLSGNYTDIRHISPFVHHISFSVFVVFSMFILLLQPLHEIIQNKRFNTSLKLLVGWFLVYLLLILKSLTGIVIFFSGLLLIMFFPGFYGFRIKPAISRTIAACIMIVITGFTGYATWKFYQTEQIDFDKLDTHTAQGNPYWHNTGERILENGHYVYIYISDKELREAWNRHSEIDYDGKDNRGQDLRYTLYRYMTALGLRKDAEGFSHLEANDLKNIENGISNPVFTKRFALYPRIYQTIWEIDVYMKTGSFVEKSLIQRIASWQIGLAIVREHPISGVGTGDVKDSYMERYEAIEYDEQPTRFITGANQWLNFAVAFGITGLLLILLAMLYPAIANGAFQSPLFALFMLIITIAMFGEDTFRYQAGLTFFAFFYGFFVFLKPVNPSWQKSIDNQSHVKIPQQ